MWLMIDQIKSKQCHFDVPTFSASLMQWRALSQLMSSFAKHKPGSTPRCLFKNQKMAQKEPEKKMSLTMVNVMRCLEHTWRMQQGLFMTFLLELGGSWLATGWWGCPIISGSPGKICMYVHWLGNRDSHSCSRWKCLKLKQNVSN